MSLVAVPGCIQGGTTSDNSGQSISPACGGYMPKARELFNRPSVVSLLKEDTFMTLKSNKLQEIIYQEAFKFLTQHIKVDKIIIEKYLKPEEKRNKPKSINEIFKAILESAQNTSMSPNVIGKSISGIKSNIDPLGNLLFDFNPSKTYDKYCQMTDKELFNIIKPSLKKIPDKQVLWLRYCKTIISASKFLKQYKNQDAFYNFIDTHSRNEQMRLFLPMLLSFEIDGLGFALACDFLKELGYINYGKPDTHIKDIFLELNLLPKIPKNSIKADYLSLKQLMILQR
jgi:hypothetical protein